MFDKTGTLIEGKPSVTDSRIFLEGNYSLSQMTIKLNAKLIARVSWLLVTYLAHSLGVLSPSEEGN